MTYFLVPLIEKFEAETSASIESEDDVRFLNDLLLKMVARERRRKDEKLGYYSPSSLGEKCVRKAFLNRHAQVNHDAPSPYDATAHRNFSIGNFMHLRWQFTFYKMEKWIANSSVFKVHGYEIPVASKRGDHRGTIDCVLSVYNEPLVIDLKGLNPFTSAKIGYGKIPKLYRMQVADYLVLWNSQKQVPFRISRGVLMVENKANGQLQEVEITLADDGRKVRRRLATLRDFEAKKTMPPPLCKAIKEGQFQRCQFRAICCDEVKASDHERSEMIRQALGKHEPTTTERVVKALKKASK
jgi:hypothetical protein